MTSALPLEHVDPSIRVQDDLFRHVNGAWLASTVIEDDRASAGAFVDLRDAAEEAVRDLITSLDPAEHEPGSETRKVADLYASFMDSETVEALGLTPLTPTLERIAAVTSIDEFVDVLGELTRVGVPGLVGVDVDADPGDPTRQLLFLGQSGLGLPDEAYYREEQHAEARADYRAHIERMLTLAGLPGADDAHDADAATMAERILALETEIAATHWDAVTSRDLQAMYNLRTAAEVAELSAGVLPRWFAAAEVGEAATAEVVVTNPDFLAGASALLVADRLADWRWWLTWRALSSSAALLPAAFVEEDFAFHGTALQGTPRLRERWKRGVGLVEGLLGEAVGQLYVERHFSPTAKARMDDLVTHVIEAYRRSITELTWMGEATRAEALHKLSTFTPKIGFPVTWRDYSALEVRPDDLMGNVRRAATVEFDREIAKAGGPVDPDEWLMTPQTVNAYYHPLRNEIVFPAAILQPPFFSETADDAVNYGGIGAVIAHEIGHGFDDQGSRCDGEGRMRNWWTDADRAAFEERTKALIGQYDVLSPEGADGQTVNGELTIGENIGDLGGLGIAHRAWTICAEEADEPARPVDGVTPEQRLFLNWGAIWRSKTRPGRVKQLLAIDPHSPAEFRCNQIVRNLDAFHRAFTVRPGDELWLDPSERVSIW